MHQREFSEQDALNLERLAVQAVDQEQQLLSRCFVDDLVAQQVVTALTPSDFGRYQHRFIFETLESLIDRSIPIGLIEVRDDLDRRGRLVDVGWDYLVDLASSSPTTAGTEYFIERVRKTAIRRHLTKAADLIRSSALNLEVDDPLAEALGIVLDVKAGKEQGRLRHITEVIDSRIAEIEAAYEARRSGDHPTVIESGFYDLDQAVLMTPGKLMILAARPAMGKSAIAFNVACHVAATHPVLHVTLEMEGEELAGRLIAADLELDTRSQAHGLVSEEAWGNLMGYSSRYAEHLLYIDDSPAATMAQVESSARRIQAQLGRSLGLLVVDYLGLVDADGKDETAKVAKVSRAAKRLAKSLKVPVLMLCQLNRGVEGRDDKRPQLSDLRQSGAIEQDADVVMFAYREEYYNPETDKKGLSEILVRKNRGGPVGKVWLKFDAAKTRFSSVTYDPEEVGHDI